MNSSWAPLASPLTDWIPSGQTDWAISLIVLIKVWGYYIIHQEACTKCLKRPYYRISLLLFQVFLGLTRSCPSCPTLYKISPRMVFRCSTAGSATKCFRAHWRLVLTTPTCCCPGGDKGVSTDRDRMAASPSVSQEPAKDKGKGLSGAWTVAFNSLHSSPFQFYPRQAFSAREIIISPGSISTDRSATSSSSSDKGLWLADRPENDFQLHRDES